MKKIIKATVLTVMMGFVSLSYASSNSSILLPEIKALALDKEVMDRTDQHVTVLETPVITDSHGKKAQGLTEITITLDNSAKKNLIILGKTLAPGGTMTIVQDLSATAGKIQIPFFPISENQNSRNSYTIDIPKIMVEACDLPYSLAQADGVCKKIDFKPVQYNCPSSDWLESGDLSSCIRTYTVSKISCPDGYTSDLDGHCNLVVNIDAMSYCDSGHVLSNNNCTKTITTAPTISCPSGYVKSGGSCLSVAGTSPSYSCPTGYYDAGGGCHRKVSFVPDPSYRCPAGYTRDKWSVGYCTDSRAYTLGAAEKQQCLDAGGTHSWDGVHYICTFKSPYMTPIPYVCPSPGTAVDSRCVNLSDREEDIVSCSSGKYFDDGVCKTSKNPIASCQVGSTLSSGTCIASETSSVKYKCPTNEYSLNGDKCSINETKNLEGVCPASFEMRGNSCELKLISEGVESCPASYIMSNGKCERTELTAAVCKNGIVNSSCDCPVGSSFNTSSLMCEGVNTKSKIITCPTGYVQNGSKCEYVKNTGLIYDYCPPEMVNTGASCEVAFNIPTTPNCVLPYSLSGNQCEYIDIKPLGHSKNGVEGKKYHGIVTTEQSSIKLTKQVFQSLVEDVVSEAVGDTKGCKLVSTSNLAKGAIKNGEILCYVEWGVLPAGIVADNNKLRGIFESAGNYNIDYTLAGFSGSGVERFEISKGTVEVTVTAPEPPILKDITTRLMNTVVSGFDINNYDAGSKVTFTTVKVSPRPYIQLVDISGVGDCEVAKDAESCSIFSSVSFENSPLNQIYTKEYNVTVNSKSKGWTDEDIAKKIWRIRNDFRGPKVLFTQFNQKKESLDQINSELGFPVTISGGTGAVGIVNQRPELPISEIWWRPSRVSLVFKGNGETQSVNKLDVNNVEVTFDLPQGNAEDIKLSNWNVINGTNGNAYPFDMKNLNPGVYSVELTVSDAYQNKTVVIYDEVKIEAPLPQIKILLNGTSIEKLSSTQSINMLDDVTVVAHNGFLGETVIKSVKVDGKEAISLNSDKHFKLLTSEGFDLKANNSYSIDVTAQDSKGREVSLSVPFNYLQMTFGFSRKPNTVIQKVEDVSLAVNRVRGLRCDLYGTKAAASLAARKNFHTCYIEWTSLPDGLTPDVTTYQAKLTGAVNAEGTVNIAYQAYIVNEHGRMGKIGGETVSIDTVPPIAISVRLDEKQKLSEGVYSVPVSDRSLGRYKGQSSRAGVIVEMTTDKGDSKMYAHNQLPFGEVQDFSSYADRLGDAQLWDKVQYTIDASYKLAPELKTVQKFDLIVTPHPYMQVLMDLDSAKYSSTDTILATVKLGMRNNMNGQFEYNESTMGTGWDIFLAFKNGSVYDPISEMVQVGSDGQGKLKVDANIIFNRNQPVYAVAKARSPFPEISIERVSVPRSITVVKGTGVEGKLVSRVVQGRLPANFDIRFDTASFADFMVMGNIDWEYKNDAGGWSAQKEFNGRQFVSIKSEIPETLVVRATITNKVTGVVTHSDEVTLISYDVPSLRLDGANQAVSGQLVTLTALDHSDTPQNDTIVEWSVDGGKTWVVGSSKYELTVGDVTMKVQARMKYANTSLAVNSGFWSEATKYISVSKPKPLTVNVNKPSIVEVGTEIDLKLQITNPFSATGVALHTEFELPDGTIISGESSIKYVVKESDLDQSNRIAMKARAWLDGYKDATLGESNIVMNTFSYEFPLESSLSLVVNNNIKFVPSTGFATLNMPIINAPGVVFSYEWSFDPEAIEKVSVSGKGMNFKVIKAGVHKITVTLSDNRGNFAFVDGFADAIEPAPLEFKVNDVYSNKFMRAPLTLSLYPSVKSSHPYDFTKQYVWTINGKKGQPSSRAVGVFEMLPAGHYDVELDVTSNFGQQGKYTASFDVKENQPPVCEPTVREQYGTHIVDANCKDSDGTISYYRWVVNGTIFSPYGAQVRFSQQDFPTATIIIEAMDDAGAVGTGRTSF